MLTNQEAFTTVGNHLINQRFKSVNDDISNFCMYRGCDGRTCAIGCLISDKDYKPSFENKPAGFIIKSIPTLSQLNEQLLARLQSFHDNGIFIRGMMNVIADSIDYSPKTGYDPNDLYEGLTHIAKEFDLSMEGINKPQ
jgi:hypothetical protein